jgi:putative transposase
MPRVARIVLPGWPHHLTQRGNNQQDVFFVDDDRRAYLAFLKERCSEAGVAILGYCLMTNHVHLIAVPSRAAALATAVGRTHFAYTQYVNRRHGRSGHLWQNRFYSCPLAEPQTWSALRYVERNPVRAGLTRAAWRYPWSSAAGHVGESPDTSGLLDLDDWAATWKPERWRALLREPLEAGETERLRRHLRTGRPLAGNRALAKLETKLGRRLRPLPVGRPRKLAEK